MIKTLMLTAQLALSPIVGTNGLQPKRLPNPVYGEEVNLSVTYEGETYTRLAYINNQTKWYFDAVDGSDIHFSLNGIYYTDGGWLQSTIGSGNLAEYITFTYNQGEATILDEYYTDTGKNLCVSFYGKDTNNNWFYYEVFGKASDGNKIRKYDYNGSSFVFDEELTDTLDETINQFYFKEAGVEWEVENRIIPLNQPTTPNPSVYDNIYNFYYQNLFANEALDELGAEVGNNSLTMRQWLAHTATIVSISLLAVALAVLVIKIFKLIAGSISDIWG